ncbi:ADP-ribosylglycohydrolase family protein, partial [Streptomyces misionensis]|uniref:ADP-ribosylglycohydrolase family protein n=1 Tax=Streptomyces misionensis TaxID=67331 RepID=UPI0036C30ACE
MELIAGSPAEPRTDGTGATVHDGADAAGRRGADAARRHDADAADRHGADAAAPEDSGRGGAGRADPGDRARGSLLGLAVGDALGAPAENMRPSEIRRRWGRIEGFVSDDPA